MPVFDQLCRAADKAQEKKLISKSLAERICAIGQCRMQYKHLGLELHGLIAELAPARANVPTSSIEALVEQIEDKHRRI